MWLREGDQNSKFFHLSAKARRKANHINSLKNSEGEMVRWDSCLQEMMVAYFNDLFRAESTDWKGVIDCVSSKVTEEQNEEMSAPIDVAEIKRDLFHMQPDKSPGPDGMIPGFYHKFWNIVGADIVKLVQDFFNTGNLEGNIADANIVLIPKKKNPNNMTELRPIYLCNVAYKVISKVINTVISDSQSAFIPGRLISDNIMIPYEIMHYMKRKKQGGCRSSWI